MRNLTNTVLNEIRLERVRQQHRWGDHSDDAINTPWMWLTYISKYSTNWSNGYYTLNSDTVSLFRECMIKVAAIAVAAVESLDRQKAKNGKPFYQVDPS